MVVIVFGHCQSLLQVIVRLIFPAQLLISPLYYSDLGKTYLASLPGGQPWAFDAELLRTDIPVLLSRNFYMAFHQYIFYSSAWQCLL
jgi:hypothetical protein